MNSAILFKKLEKDLTGVRQRKVQKIKNKIATGKYQIDSVQLAKVLLQAV